MPVTAKVNIASMADMPHPPEYVNNLVLAASTAESLTVPSDADCVILNYTADTWVRVGATAIVPAADVTDGTGCFLSPTSMRGIAGKTLSFISATAGAIVCGAFYRAQ